MPRTLKDPLEESIKKWEKNLEVSRKELGKPIIRLEEEKYSWQFGKSKIPFTLGVDNCPLCDHYIGRCRELCPVGKRTGSSACKGTPYTVLEPMLLYPTIRKVTKKFIKLVEAEVEFLRSL